MAITANAVWRARPGGLNTNSGGFDASLSGAGTDYSQQNAAQASGSNATCTTGTSTFVDATANAFTSTMVGNCIQIASGTNFTVGFYFVTGFTSASTVTLDRSPVGGSNGSVGVWKLGGGWADWWTNTTSSGPLVAGNTVYVLGSSVPNPASYTYDYTYTGAGFTLAGAFNSQQITIANDPATPGYKAPPDTTGGMPLTSWRSPASGGIACQNVTFAGLWIAGGTGADFITPATNNRSITLFGCVYDQLGGTTRFVLGLTSESVVLIGCEVFSSTGASSNSTTMCQLVAGLIGCNIHDCNGNGASLSSPAIVMNSVIAKNAGTGIVAAMNNNEGETIVIGNNTIDGNGGSGISISTQEALLICRIFNNILSNHTAGSTYGITVGSGTLAANDKFKSFIDYNTYYNNNADLNLLSYGPHDTHGGVNPYVNQSTEDYDLV